MPSPRRSQPARSVDVSAASGFARVAAADEERGDPQAQQAFAVLELVIRRSLGSLRQAIVRGDGVVEVPFFVLGTSPAGR